MDQVTAVTIAAYLIWCLMALAALSPLAVAWRYWEYTQDRARRN